MTAHHSPRRLSEALRILADSPGAMPVAGCTDLMVVDHATGRHHAAVVDVLKLPELRGIHLSDAGLDIGAATTFTQLRGDAQIRAHAPILAEIAGTIGALQIQNRATLGGNIANASPAGDSLPVLLALGASLVLAGPTGEREVPYDAFHLGYRKTALRPGELITRVRIPKAGADAFTAVKKVGTREAQAISKVLVAFYAETAGGRLGEVRIGAGSVAATPVRLRDTEALITGQRVTDGLARDAAETARREVTPIDDVRSSAPYRHFALGQVVLRMVMEAGARADGRR